MICLLPKGLVCARQEERIFGSMGVFVLLKICLFLLSIFPFQELQLGLDFCYRVYFPNE